MRSRVSVGLATVALVTLGLSSSGLATAAATVAHSSAATQRSSHCGHIRQTPKGGDGQPVKSVARRDVPVSAHGGSVGGTPWGYADFNANRSAWRTITHCGDAVEGDWRLTSDGMWVKHHDDSLQGLTHTNCGGTISHTRRASLYHCRTAAGSRVSSLYTYLKSISTSSTDSCGSITLQLELKIYPSRAHLRTFIDQIKRFGFEKCALIVNPSTGLLRNIKSIDPLIQTGWITFSKTKPSTHTLRQLTHSVDYLMLDNSVITYSYVKTAHSLGFRVSSRSVNSASLMRSLAKTGVDRFVTDTLSTSVWTRNRL